LLLVGCENGRYSGTLIFDGQHRFEAGERLPGNVLLRAGTAEFDTGSQVAGPVYVIGGSLLAVLVLAGLGGLWVSWRPQPLRRVASVANDHPLVALSIGLLALLVLPILLVMMAFTIVLLPLVLILGLLILLTIGMGLISLGMAVGNWLAARAGRAFAPGWATFGGVLLLLLLFQLPVVGAVLSLATAVFLFGAVLLTRFGTHPYNSPQPPAADLATYKRPS
jgi:hypothetical protein